MDIKNNKKRSIRRDSILEALRDVGQSTLEPNQPVSFENREDELRRSFERRIRQQEIIRRQEFEVFSAKKEEEKAKIQALQAEVMELAKGIENLNKEVKVASIQQTVNPGVYHEAFFTKLVSFIKSLRKKVNDASIWLAATNKRARKQPYYWQQVRKSGTRFMLSQERYMSTQAG
jgi:predicted RNase H-like nuclease (RuvC/YqgF family)